MRVFTFCLLTLCSLVFGREAAGDNNESATKERSQPVTWAIAIHGGCGSGDRLVPDDVQREYNESLRAALTLGKQLLAAGGSSLDVVEQVARRMEDDGNFNAGRGGVFNREGQHELDASIMDGRNLACGAVASVRTVKNPISLARMVMEETKHVMLIGEGADLFARQMQIPAADPEYFYTPRLRQLWNDYQAQQSANRAQLDFGGSRGTIGVVARDQDGNLAAATSTGGLCYKMPGRAGDSPIIGAGTYAKNGVLAVSCTGHGEEFIRHSVAHSLTALVEYKGLSVAEAARQLIRETLPAKSGGLIAVGHDGTIVLEYSTRAMLRGAADSSGRFDVAIFD